MRTNFKSVIKRIIPKGSTRDEFSSVKYWENRYARGDNSGSGSYDNLAEFKAEVINKFVKSKKIQTVIEFGVGDGNQLLLANYPHYIGLDVSATAIKMCKKLFKGDDTKKFYTLDKFKNQKAQLTMSLDVLFHLVEQDVFEKHIHDLFKASTDFVIIYAADNNKFQTAEHVKSRKFSDYVNKNITGWKLVQHIPNKYPYDPSNPEHTTWADFYIYKHEDKK